MPYRAESREQSENRDRWPGMGERTPKPGPSSETSTRKRPFGAGSALTLTSAPSRRGVTAYFTAFSTSVC